MLVAPGEPRRMKVVECTWTL